MGAVKGNDALSDAAAAILGLASLVLAVPIALMTLGELFPNPNHEGSQSRSRETSRMASVEPLPKRPQLSLVQGRSNARRLAPRGRGKLRLVSRRIEAA